MTPSSATTNPTVTQVPVPAPLPPSPGVPAPRRRPRSAFWPGFALGFLLLSALSCGALSATFGLTRLTLADIQGSGPGWTPAPSTPAPVVQAEAADAAPAPGVSNRFPAGATVRNLTNSRVNVRATPGYLSKPDGDVIGVLPPDGTAIVLSESQLADNLVWWRVRATVADGRAIDGWVAEATASGVQILGQ